MRYRVSVAAILLLLVLLVRWVAWPLVPSEIAAIRFAIAPTTVTSLNDNGPGSLRQAIAVATPGSTITFEASLQGSIVLTNVLNITKSLNIRGPRARVLSISGGNNIYRVNVHAGTFVTISGLTFQNSTDSGIFNEGTLTLINSVITNNKSSGYFAGLDGGGIYNNGTLTLTNSTVSGNTSSARGGGIANDGVLTLTNSTVSGNRAFGEGGGIVTYTDSTLIITNSTISGNMVFGEGSDGGGIANGPNSRVTLTNSTISGNTSSGKGGGISNFGSQVDIEFCTIYGNKTSGNGGGISIEDGQDNNGKTVHSRVSIRNSIIAENPTGTGPNISGPLTSDGYNLVQDISGVNFAPNQQHSTDVSVDPHADLKIDSLLRDNGGPTKTLALLPGSPALDKIPLDACHVKGITTDQRGVKRPDGDEGACDIGAYESSP